MLTNWSRDVYVLTDADNNKVFNCFMCNRVKCVPFQPWPSVRDNYVFFK